MAKDIISKSKLTLTFYIWYCTSINGPSKSKVDASNRMNYKAVGGSGIQLHVGFNIAGKGN